MRVGSLCTGIMGAELALEVLGLDPDLRWYAEIDKDASKLLAEKCPGVPNLGDIKQIDWSATEPVDILTAGYPCQPFSQAGKRKGTDDPRHLWPFILDAVGILGPRNVLLENVAGHLSLGGPEVVGSLAALGYCVRWTTLRASDVGACHRRDRLWIAATHPEGTRGRMERGGSHNEGRPPGNGGGNGPTTPRASIGHGG